MLNFLSSLREAELLTPTIVSGLQVYFDKSLGANLLYRFERPQYAEIRKRYITGPKVIIGQEKEMSAIYGAEHLLRMIGEFQPKSSFVSAYFIQRSESTADGSYLYDGCRVCGLGAGLCERAARVSFFALELTSVFFN